MSGFASPAKGLSPPPFHQPASLCSTINHHSYTYMCQAVHRKIQTSPVFFCFFSPFCAALRCAVLLVLVRYAINQYVQQAISACAQVVRWRHAPHLVVLDLLLDESPSPRPQQVVHSCMVVELTAMCVRLRSAQHADVHTSTHTHWGFRLLLTRTMMRARVGKAGRSCAGAACAGARAYGAVSACCQ